MGNAHAAEDAVPLNSTLAFAPCVWTAAARAPESSSHLTILSFNVPCNTGDNVTGSKEWYENLFKHRKHKIVELLSVYKVDIACLQEPHERQTREIRELLDEDWNVVGRGREADGSSEYGPIFFRPSRVKLLEQGCFWLSEHSDQPGSKSWGAACTRHVTWAKFTPMHLIDSDEDSAFLVFNTHFDHMSALARLESARVLNHTVSKLRLGSPALVCGDFNEEREEPAMQMLLVTGILKLLPGVEEKKEATFLGWKRTHTKEYDYILMTSPMTSCAARLVCERLWVLRDCFADGRVLSDHCPLLTRISLHPRAPIIHLPLNPLSGSNSGNQSNSSIQSNVAVTNGNRNNDNSNNSHNGDTSIGNGSRGDDEDDSELALAIALSLGP